jgi:integrase
MCWATDADGKRTSHNKTIHGTKDDARRYLNGFLRDRDLGVYAESNESVGALLDALLDDYEVNGKCLWWAKGVVRVHLRPFFGAMRASAVGTREIQSYIAMRRKPSTRKMEKGGTRAYKAASNATVNRELAILRSAFHMGRKCDPPKVHTVPHILKLKESAPRKGFFERDAFLAVRSQLPEEIRPVITFGFYTGCRRGEVMGLRWEQVDLAEGVVRLNAGETKNDEGRVIPLAPELREMLAMLKAQRDESWPKSGSVFSRGGEPILNFRKSWAQACKQAGHPGLLFHDLRRTGVRNLIRAGVPEVVAMRISGHKTRSMLDRYNVVSEADLKDAGRKLGEYLKLAAEAPKAEPTSIRPS